MDASEAHDLNEALARTYQEQRKLEESPPGEGAGRIAWAAFCARRAGLALERAILERLASERPAVVPGQVAGAGAMAATDEVATPRLFEALTKASKLPSLPWSWGEMRDGEVPRIQWIGSHAGPVVEAYGGAAAGPTLEALGRLAALAPAVMAEALASRLALSVLGKAAPKTAEEVSPYLVSARVAVQMFVDHATRTGRPVLYLREAQAMAGPAGREIVSWLAALGVLATDPVDMEQQPSVASG